MSISQVFIYFCYKKYNYYYNIILKNIKNKFLSVQKVTVLN